LPLEGPQQFLTASPSQQYVRLRQIKCKAILIAHVIEGYRCWTAIAGFFDGDGSVDVDVRVYTLHWTISFTDNWLGQIEQIRHFLIKEGIRVGKPRRVGVGGWMCEIKEISSVMTSALKMLQSGGIYKKRAELKLVLDYYSDKITAQDALKALNREVQLGIRVGKLRDTDMPYTRSQGLERARYASSFEQRKLESYEIRELISEYLSTRMTGKSLAKKYDISEATVSRLLRRSGIDTNTRARTLSSAFRSGGTKIGC